MTIALLAIIMVSISPFARTAVMSWNLGDRKAELLQNARVGMEVITTNLRQAKRICKIPWNVAGDYVAVRNAYDNQTIVFFWNIATNPYYVGNTGLIHDNSLVMCTINNDTGTASAAGCQNSLLAKSLSNFSIIFKNATGSEVSLPYRVDAMDILLNLSDPEGFVSDTVVLKSTVALRPSVRINESAWAGLNGRVVELAFNDAVTGLSTPSHISVNKVRFQNSRETVWVSDSADNSVSRIYWTGSAWARTRIAGFSSPQGVVANPNETSGGLEVAYVADTGNNRICRLTWSGSAWTTTALSTTITDTTTGAVSAFSFNGPRSIVGGEYYNGRHTFWVADTANNMIDKGYYDSASGYYNISNVTYSGIAPRSISFINSGSYAGNTFIALTGTNEIGMETFNTTGSTGNILNFTSPWPMGGFSAPNSIAANAATSEVWVADTGRSRVAKVSFAGALVLNLSGFNAPSVVAIAPINNQCWVADTGNNQIVRLDAEGNEEFRISGFTSTRAVNERL